MESTDSDLLIVGGGLAGSALAKAMAQAGARVILLEQEQVFRDRVRGEAIVSWGVAEARRLGIYETIVAAGGHELPFWDSYNAGSRSGHRDLLRTSAPKEPVLACFHPLMQEALIQAAADAGADVRRGARIRQVKNNGVPTVVAEIAGQTSEIRARLVVGADGRNSLTRGWGGFEVRHDQDRNMVAGVLLDSVSAPEDASHGGLNSDLGLYVILFPQGEGRARAYVCYPAKWQHRLTGDTDIPRFLDESQQGGFPEDFYSKATVSGPLATFSGASAWVEHSYGRGIALVGDAAATTDPTWGQGLSMALRDARELRDQLLKFQDWDEAGHAYAELHKQYHDVVHTAENWQTKLLLETGPVADARRERALPLWRQDRTRVPDTFLSGPGPTLDEAARRRYFGED